MTFVQSSDSESTTASRSSIRFAEADEPTWLDGELDGIILDLTGPEPVVLFDVAPDMSGHQVWAPRYGGLLLGAKRLLDFVGATTMLVALSPVVAGVAAAVRLTDGGPIYFAQDRVGRHGKTFRVLKFRTMCNDAEAVLRAHPELLATYLDNDFKLEPSEDPRVTRIGHFLRRSSLDELPQLFNVLRGEMSLVGPRPVLEEELVNYGEVAPAYLAVYPGVTGPWQVGGRNDIRYPERAHVDAQYAQRWSFWGDVKILLKTIPSVISQRGVL